MWLWGLHTVKYQLFALRYLPYSSTCCVRISVNDCSTAIPAVVMHLIVYYEERTQPDAEGMNLY